MGWQPDPRGCPPEAVPPRSITSPDTLWRMRSRAERDGLDLDETYESKRWWDRRWVALQHSKPVWPWGKRRRAWDEEMKRADDGARTFGKLLLTWMGGRSAAGLVLFQPGATERVQR